MTELRPGFRRGKVAAPPSKSHAHRLLIADFLAGDDSQLDSVAGDSDDVLATKRCLRALREPTDSPILDCGESGSTLRFLMPVAAALGKRPIFQKRGRLADRPVMDCSALSAGRHEIAGNVSSQFVTGLLFALPLLKGDSEICFTSPLESRGYVDMSLDVLKGAGIVVDEMPGGFRVAGGQRYHAQGNVTIEGDWSGAAFWLAMNALGSEVTVTGLNDASRQPDREVVRVLSDFAESANDTCTVDVSQFPDSFPVLAVVAAARKAPTVFRGIQRLRFKECDRVMAMADVLGRFGVAVETTEDRFVVSARGEPFKGGVFCSFGDHRVAMSVAVGATVAEEPVLLDDISCAAKSYPEFFTLYERLSPNKENKP